MYQLAAPAAPSGMATKLGGLLSRCAVACLLAITVSVWAGAAPAGAADSAAAGAQQSAAAAAATATDADTPVAIDQRQLVDPKPSVAPPVAPDDGDNAKTDGDAAPQPPAPPSAVTKAELARGNAATQLPPAKQEEAKQSCDARPPPTSQLLAVGGSVASDPPKSWTLWAVVACLAAAGVAGGAFHLRKRGHTAAGKGPLEHVATVVAIAAGVAALTGQFVPGVGVHDAPPPEASMQVREVNARITRGDYASAVKAPQPRSPLDRREIGNVVWLAIHLEGYRGKTLTLQWGSYDLAHGKTFVPGSDKATTISVTEDNDVQTVFQPIWVGYPQQAQFRVAFRLLDGGQVREIARTGKMRGALYRYSCPAKV
jgi:hypothetical protein